MKGPGRCEKPTQSSFTVEWRRMASVLLEVLVVVRDEAADNIR